MGVSKQDVSLASRKEWRDKKDATMPPTVHNESVLITGAIDTHDKRDVMILDIPRTFPHALTKDKVNML